MGCIHYLQPGNVRPDSFQEYGNANKQTKLLRHCGSCADSTGLLCTHVLLLWWCNESFSVVFDNIALYSFYALLL